MEILIRRTHRLSKISIMIIGYGKENLSHILEKDYKAIFNRGFKSVQALVESIHFNRNKPENAKLVIIMMLYIKNTLNQRD